MGLWHVPLGREGIALEIGLVRVRDVARVVAVDDDVVADDAVGGAHYGGKIWIDD